MKHRIKLSQEQQQEHTAEQHQSQQIEREFASPEELLRYDASQTTVPPGIVEKLQQSLGPLKTPSRRWWEKLFGRK